MLTPEEQARRGNFERLTVMVTIESNGAKRAQIVHKDRSADYRDGKIVYRKQYSRLEGDPRTPHESLLDAAHDALADYDFDHRTGMKPYRG